MQFLIRYILISLFTVQASWATATGVQEFDDKVHREITELFQQIKITMSSQNYAKEKFAQYLKEHVIFSRDNAPLIGRAAERAIQVPEIYNELMRNFKEESGVGQPMSHYEMYKRGVLELEITVDSDVYSYAMEKLTQAFDKILEFGSLSAIVGAFYVSEVVAIPELEVMQDVVYSYAQNTNKTVSPSGLLQLYYDIHLNGAEQSHQDELGKFVKEYEAYGLNLQEIKEGGEIALKAMKDWWLDIQSCEENLTKIHDPAIYP